MKVVIVSGTPGTGKTTIAKRLAKRLDFYYIDANKVISEFRLSEGYDRKRKTRIIDVNNLNKKLVGIVLFFKKHNGIFLKNKNNWKLKILNKKNKIKKYNGIIIDSHLSHYLPRKYVDLCIITKCDIKELSIRLKRKGFHKAKIKENVQAEIFDVCHNEALERKHKVFVINTTKGFNINSLTHKIC